MERIILKSKSEEELRDKISKTLVLGDDETVSIREITKPFKFLFFSRNGEYEVTIIKKSELNIKNENSKKQDKNLENKKKKVEKKNIKSNDKNKNLVDEDKKLSLLKNITKEFLAISNLKVEIKKIELKSNIYKIELDGEDVKYIIGEKGVALSSLEYLFMSLEEFKHSKIFIDSNNYKDKREVVLRELANKTAKNVLRTKKKVKLNPMPSRERKIIHEEISKIPELETISVGVEPKRCLIIKLKK